MAVELSNKSRMREGVRATPLMCDVCDSEAKNANPSGDEVDHSEKQQDKMDTSSVLFFFFPFPSIKQQHSLIHYSHSDPHSIDHKHSHSLTLKTALSSTHLHSHSTHTLAQKQHTQSTKEATLCPHLLLLQQILHHYFLTGYVR